MAQPATTELGTSLLTEIERQRHYLAQLPENYEWPLFSGRQAVESQRRSGYKNTACAAREIVDNAFEAGAKNVWITFERPKEKDRKANEPREAVSAVAFIDDGPGMLPKMARYSLCWGGGTHFEDPNLIGKFGFGLPNSSINQTRRVEVYTRTDSSQPWMRAVLDINFDNVPSHGMVKIPEPAEASLPKFVSDFLAKQEIELKSGTIVVWVKPDRLSFKKASTLAQHLVEDFGVVYREMLSDFNLVVDGKTVNAVDPLFLTEGAFLYKSPADGGAILDEEREITVKCFRDPETGGEHLESLSDVESVRAARAEPGTSVGVIKVKVAHFPYGFARGERKYKGTEEYKRYEIRKPRRGMSFVRGGREIETVDVFPKGSKEEAAGMGEWPLLQAYAYHWGIEVSFGPELDEAFGIGNDKQTVRPIEDFWRVLAKEEVDKLLRKAQEFQRTQRKKAAREEAEKKLGEQDAHAPATEAAAQAEAVTGRTKSNAPKTAKARKERVRKSVEEKQQTGQSTDEAERAVQDEAKRKKFAISFFDADGGVFYRPGLGNGLQVVAEINRRHPFYSTFYEHLALNADARARHAIDVLLLALAKAELGVEEDNHKDFYEHQREREWSDFLKYGLKHLERLQESPASEEEQDNSDPE